MVRPLTHSCFAAGHPGERPLSVRHRLKSMNNLASTLGRQGDLSGARALQEQVLSSCRRVLGERHPDTTVSAWNLVTTLHRIGESESAARILRECLAWLVSVDAASLSADQREIRGRVAVISSAGQSGVAD